MRIIKYFIICLIFNLTIKSTIGQTTNDSLKTNFKRIYFIAGLGFPEFVHAGIGYYVNRNISLDIVYGNVILNNMLGIGSTYYFYRKRNNTDLTKSLFVNVTIRTNPNNNPLKIQSGGDTLGSMLELYIGYSYCGLNGFVFKAQVGIITTIEDNQLGGGLNTKLGIGYCF
jgi:hypothetical protein